MVMEKTRRYGSESSIRIYILIGIKKIKDNTPSYKNYKFSQNDSFQRTIFPSLIRDTDI